MRFTVDDMKNSDAEAAGQPDKVPTAKPLTDQMAVEIARKYGAIGTFPVVKSAASALAGYNASLAKLTQISARSYDPSPLYVPEPLPKLGPSPMVGHAAETATNTKLLLDAQMRQGEQTIQMGRDIATVAELARGDLRRNRFMVYATGAILTITTAAWVFGPLVVHH